MDQVGGFTPPTTRIRLGSCLCPGYDHFVHPDTLAKLINYLNVYRIGEHTYVTEFGAVGEANIDSMLVDAYSRVERGETYAVHNSYGGFGGTVPEGREPFVKQLSSLSITTQMVEFPLLVPTYFDKRIPKEFRFQKAQIMPDGSAILYFGLSICETMLRYVPVGENSFYGHSQTTMTIDSTGNRHMQGIIPDLEELEMEGKQVYWQVHNDQWRKQLLGNITDSYQDLVIGKFMWEADGISYTLDGKLLTKEEGIKIIESLKEMPNPNH